jgi:hypothetical protein
MDNQTVDPRPRHRRPVLWLVGGVIVVGLAAAVAIGFFGVHKLFVDDLVDEAGPSFSSGAASPGDAPPTTAPSTATPAPGDGATSSTTSTSVAPAVVELARGSFEGRGRYDATGTVVVLNDGTEERFLRFEADFATDNGPDLFVYLETGSGRYGDPSEAVELGMLRGNIGAQNYEIPVVHPVTGEPIDLERFTHVAVWCRRFDSAFGVAVLDLAEAVPAAQ